MLTTIGTRSSALLEAGVEVVAQVGHLPLVVLLVEVGVVGRLPSVEGHLHNKYHVLPLNRPLPLIADIRRKNLPL